MDCNEVSPRVFQLFAQMLEYPRPGLAAAVSECKGLVSSTSPKAAVLLGAFHAFVEATPVGRLEEIYTGAFDLDATSYPYVGFHLFGESYKRSIFMIGLKERYRDCNFAIPGNDLPDHVAVVLRFLAVCEDTAMAGDLIQDALLPTLKRMTAKSADEAEPDGDVEPGSYGRRASYKQVLGALKLCLEPGAAGREPGPDGDGDVNPFSQRRLS